MNAVIYARYSCDNQREESIEGQLRECKAFAEHSDIRIIGTYVDRAMSAKTDNRPEFQRMIKESGKGLFEQVIVWKLDRFARNRYDSAHYKMILKKNGVKVISATETISEGAEGIILESMLEGVAEYYSAELSEKVKRGMMENALKCQYNGGMGTIGYLIDDQKRYILDPDVAPFVKQAFVMYSECRTIKSIVEYLNENHVLSAYKKPMTKTSVTSMLSNCKYKGVYHYGDVDIPDGVPRIVSDELFDKVQERLKTNKISRSRFKAKEEYFLSIKTYCGYCGALVDGESGHGRNNIRYSYYKCSNAKKHEDLCNMRSVRKDYLEPYVFDDIITKMISPDIFDEIADTALRCNSQDTSSIDELNEQLRQVDEYIDNLVTAMQMGMLTKSTKKRLDELEAQKEEIELAIISEKIKEDRISRKDIMSWLMKMKSIDLSEDANKRHFVDKYMSHLIVKDNELLVYFKLRDNATNSNISDGIISDCYRLGEPEKIPYASRLRDFLYL